MRRFRIIRRERKINFYAWRLFPPAKRKCVRPAIIQNELLKTTMRHGVQHLENLDKVALARAIGTNNDIEILEFKIFKFPNGFKPLY